MPAAGSLGGRGRAPAHGSSRERSSPTCVLVHLEPSTQAHDACTDKSRLLCAPHLLLLVNARANTYRHLVHRHRASRRPTCESPSAQLTLPAPQTCTVWDISTSVPITQLIAHDREVYDVAWSPSSRDVFASVGADGSVRMFDLRSLEHSTILYEATPAPAAAKNGAPASPNPAASGTSTLPSPLLRLAFSPTSPTYVSVCHADSADVQILDTRSPGTPAMEVRGHSGAVNGMAWGGSTISGAGETSGPGWLATCCASRVFFSGCGHRGGRVLTAPTCRSGRLHAPPLGPLNDSTESATDLAFRTSDAQAHPDPGTLLVGTVRDQRGRVGRRRRLGRGRVRATRTRAQVRSFL